MFESVKKKLTRPTKAELWKTILEMRKESETNAYFAGFGAGYQRAVESMTSIDISDLIEEE